MHIVCRLYSGKRACAQGLQTIRIRVYVYARTRTYLEPALTPPPRTQQRPDHQQAEHTPPHPLECCMSLTSEPQPAATGLFNPRTKHSRTGEAEFGSAVVHPVKERPLTGMRA